MSERVTGRPGRRRVLRIGSTLAAIATAGCSGLISDSPSRTAGEEAETYTLAVRLVNGSDEPVTEASVSVATAEGLIQRAEAKVPDRDGVVRFDIEGGDYIVQIESQEYTNVEEPVTVEGEDVEVTVTLERGFA